MHLIGLIVIIYVILAEWRIAKLKKRWGSCMSHLAKMQKDKTLWYSGVLPKADELCLFQNEEGHYLISTLNERRLPILLKSNVGFTLKIWIVFSMALKNILFQKIGFSW